MCYVSFACYFFFFRFESYGLSFFKCSIFLCLHGLRKLNGETKHHTQTFNGNLFQIFGDENKESFEIVLLFATFPIKWNYSKTNLCFYGWTKYAPFSWGEGGAWRLKSEELQIDWLCWEISNCVKIRI